MKIPCEIVVWYVLPTIRREVARELVFEHGMSQAQVARKFEVTDAAISQYLKKKRGENEKIQNSERYELFSEEIKKSAGYLAAESSDFVTEMCRLCSVVKNCGMLAEIYEQYTGYDPPICAMADADIQKIMLKE